MMKHRDRVLTALHHKEPDRCPMQISFTPEFAARIKRELALDDAALHNPHGGGNTYIIERRLDEDLLLTSVGWANSYYASESYDQVGDSYTDEWGVVWRSVPYETRFGTGHYTEMVGHPLAEDEAIERYRPPDPNRPELYLEAERVLDAYQDEYWIVGVTVTTIFETAWALRGYEKTLMDLALNPDYVERLFDIPFHYHLTAAKKLTELGVDMIWLGDDIGSQDRLLISPATWRRFLKPRMATFIETLKGINPRLKIAYHSDGDISPLIPELIEIGLDVLNPIQPRSMDPAVVKKTYGKNLCFWGSIDEQHTLPFGSPADVEREVIQRLGSIGQGGGLIIGPTHHVQLDTPLANFWAMANTIRNTPYSTM
ncbi:MAG: uroporphyrinogen decarboxylase family protein [Chloroflexota bacterium]|jgi:uroporphyrinogen decarboxylase